MLRARLYPHRRWAGTSRRFTAEPGAL